MKLYTKFYNFIGWRIEVWWHDRCLPFLKIVGTGLGLLAVVTFAFTLPAHFCIWFVVAICILALL